MKLLLPFIGKLKTVDETPEPLRSAALAALKPDDEIRLLVFAEWNG
ncbi:MAG: hypothetical protein ACREDS_01350 [Limisphaerales bacterium]